VRSVSKLLERGSARGGDVPVFLAPGRASLSYAQLHELVVRSAGGLREIGLGPASRVAMLVENGPEAATAFLAIASVAAAAPLNPAYRARELDAHLESLKADALVVSNTLETPAREVARERGLRVIELEVDRSAPAGAFTFADVGPAVAIGASPSSEAVALLLHTSGTTSRPKLVPLTHRQLCLSAENVAATLQLAPTDRCLSVMPLFHIHGIVASLLGSLAAGASVACTPGFHQVRFFDWLDELQPTWYTAVPTMHAAVLARLRDRKTAVEHRLRLVRSSSAALPLPVLEGLEATLGVPVIEAYGMTEAAHQIASNPLPPGVRKPGSVGLAAGPEIAVLDPDGRVLEPGQVGQVAIRGPSVFSGYERNPEANADAFSDGWFRTGDEGSLDREGYLTLRGRIKEIINRGGEKISPLEIDDVLLSHDAVEQAVAFGMADAHLGEEVAAAVVLTPNATADERELQDFVADQLAPFKVPRRIVVLDEIPKGATGKVARIGMAERIGITSRGGDTPDRPPYVFLEPALIAIWESVLEARRLGVNADFFALGGDSILAAEAVARVRDLVGDPDLPLTSIVRAPTPATMAREVFSDTTAGRSGVIPLRAEGSRAPLFFVHPGDGDVLAYAVLARRLDLDQPVYALRARGIDDGAAPPVSIVEMAAGYVDDIRSVQPHGPYVLGGFCVGGAIAFEMASQLEVAGETVAALILLDPRFGRPDGARYAAWLVWRRIRQGRRVARALARRLLRLAGWRSQEPLVGAGELVPTLARLREGYRPQPSDLPATVVLSTGFQKYELPEWHLRGIIRRPRRWHPIRTEHSRLLLPPNVDLVAQEIEAALNDANLPRRAA
jgi:acyl-CoA synthetase (AMP-forming)/AMP-acid ligase II/thioesterase domain-containing protein